MNEMTNDAAVAYRYRAIGWGEIGPWHVTPTEIAKLIFGDDRYEVEPLVLATTVAELRAEVERLQALSAAISRDCNECANQRNAAIADGRKLAEALDRVVGWCNGVMNHPNIAFNPELYEAAKQVKALTKESP